MSTAALSPAPMTIENMTLDIKQETHVNATLEVTFAALLEQFGPSNERGPGDPMPMIIEPWPGGRWYRDLGNNNGHLWGHVQAIKRPTLLEFCGPLFASYPFLSNVQFRLKEVEGGTLIAFRHSAIGFIQEDHKRGVSGGWASMLERTRKHAEAQ